MKRFLTARWEDLVMANYAVEPSLLESRIPNGTELDIFDGKCYVSLVAFKFLNTKVLGIPVPFHTDFEEVNLRFYVTRKTRDELRRGVVFVKEIVPKAAISFVARFAYGEPYETWRMSHKFVGNELTYEWSNESCSNRLYTEIAETMGVPEKGSHAEFIIEHYWGYTRRGNNRTDEYHVAHPKWGLFDLSYAEIDVDFAKTYGEEFGFLTDTEPETLLLAKGSSVEVYRGERLRVR